MDLQGDGKHSYKCVVEAALMVGSLPCAVYTANSISQFVIGSQTLNPGAAVTVSSTPISLVIDASEAVIGSSTVPLYPAGITPASGSGSVPILIFAGST